MSGAQFIKDAPVWVWILLVFLIQRGINALSDREMRIERLFLLPLLFLVWGVYSVIHETANPSMALAVMLVGLIIGMAAGWGLWRSQPRLRNGAKSGFIIRSGTPLTLALISQICPNRFTRRLARTVLFAALQPAVWPAQRGA